MQKMVFGTFESSIDANNALSELYTAGIDKGDISVIVPDSVAKQGLLKDIPSTGENAAKGATGGAATGAALGALGGFLVGVGAITVPALGPLLIAGPLATALGLTGTAAAAATGAVGGALAGGLLGTMVGMGLPQEQALVYEEKIKSGNILLSVNAENDIQKEAVEDIYQRNKANEINYYTLT